MASRRAAALRDADGVDLRDHLIAVTARLLAQRGAAGLTVRRIAREARVADGVLYNHFADKEELLAHALRAHVLAVERALEQPPSPGSGALEDNLRAHIAHGLALHAAILPAFAGLLAEPTVLARFAALTAGEPPTVRQRLVAYLRAEQELGRVRRDTNVEVTATIISGACHELVMAHLVEQPTQPFQAPPGLVDDLADTVLRGIRGAPRR
ncbi:TetR/AcrR family transcriptional regulator [Thermasporomyces composti]|mgnify:CR=1 FL=1|jgi:AcrR family transcriptional regulator|uniref:TetR family transcriptional regulator n=1 Tax=Thermasporomyces composti TaxID=696763 RepID=A0A3D9V428_THECX|nr:TetR/AcrR family transcriptional regulator [Thermasporomyces composti]REF36126.1 TetR family transcriptional regulator [Thermasporomyces composti]